MQITVTDAAIQHIQKILAAASAPSVFRLGVKKSGCSGYRYDPQIVPSAKEGDLKMVLQEDWSVYVEAGTEKFYDGLVVDIEKKFLGHELVFKNPNAEDECGCGESFNLKDKD